MTKNQEVIAIATTLSIQLQKLSTEFQVCHLVSAAESLLSLTKILDLTLLSPVTHDIHKNVRNLESFKKQKISQMLKECPKAPYLSTLWLKYSFEFLLQLLENIVENDTLELSVAAREVYKNTLKLHHGLPIQLIFGQGLKLLPKRESLGIEPTPELIKLFQTAKSGFNAFCTQINHDFNRGIE